MYLLPLPAWLCAFRQCVNMHKRIKVPLQTNFYAVIQMSNESCNSSFSTSLYLLESSYVVVHNVHLQYQCPANCVTLFLKDDSLFTTMITSSSKLSLHAQSDNSSYIIRYIRYLACMEGLFNGY
jgi:hypothetical protein